MSLLSFCPGRHGAGRGEGEGPELPERAQVTIIIKHLNIAFQQ